MLICVRQLDRTHLWLEPRRVSGLSAVIVQQRIILHRLTPKVTARIESMNKNLLKYGATEKPYLPVVLFITLFKMALTF